MTIRLRIKEILEERGKSNYWLSQQLGMCYRNYHNIVTNKTSAIRFDTMERLCEILEIPVAELFEEIDDPIDTDQLHMAIKEHVETIFTLIVSTFRNI